MVKYLVQIFIVVAIISSASIVVAQQTIGCVFNNNIYYVGNGTSGGFPNYNTNPNITVASAFCVANLGGSCRVNKKSNQTGTLKTFYFVQCPIDDYIPLFIMLVGGFGIFRLRKLGIA